LMSTHPEAFTQLLSAVDFHLDSPSEIVLAGTRGDADTNRMLGVVQSRFAPNEIVALKEPDDGNLPQPPLASILLEGREMKDGVATAYVCRGYKCHQPVTDPTELMRLLVEGD